MIEKNKLKFGVIGIGYRFSIALKAHQLNQELEIVAGADPALEARERFQKEIGSDVPTFSSAEEMLQKVELDGVFILSPDYLHLEHALLAIKHGLSIFLEKPMAISIAECEQILDQSKRANVKVYVGHNMRHMKFVTKMKELVDGGAIGEVKTAWCRHFISFGGDCYFKDWHADRRFSNSLLVQKASHDLDILNWICGGKPELVTAMGNLSVYDKVTDIDPNPKSGKYDREVSNWPPSTLKGRNPIVDVEDLSMLMLKLDNGVLISYQQCHYTPDNWRNYTIIGTKGRIENFGDRTDDNVVIKLWNEKCHYNEAGNAVYKVPADNREGDQLMLTEFIHFLKDENAPLLFPEEAPNSIAIGAAATESLRNGSMPQHLN